MFVIWTLFAILAILLILLVVPLDFYFSVQRHEGKLVVLNNFRWLFGLVSIRTGGPVMKPRTAPKRTEKKKKRRLRKRRGSRYIMGLLRKKGFGSRLLKLARKLLQHVHIHNLSMVIRVGLDDPADTGRLWAIIGPIAALLTLPKIVNVTIEPEFTVETLEVDGEGHIRIIPIQFVFTMLAFVLSPSTLHALYAMRATSS